jgi:hypothetical protein
MSKEENAEDSKQIGNQSKLNLLVTGTVDGMITIHALGLMACGSVDSKQLMDNCKCHVLSVQMDSMFKSLIATICVQTDGAVFFPSLYT